MSLDRTVSTEELLSAFDVGGRTAAEHIGTEALLFQTGYLTITVEESSSHGRLDWRCAPAGNSLQNTSPASALCRTRSSRPQPATTA